MDDKFCQEGETNLFLNVYHSLRNLPNFPFENDWPQSITLLLPHYVATYYFLLNLTLTFAMPESIDDHANSDEIHHVNNIL